MKKIIGLILALLLPLLIAAPARATDVDCEDVMYRGARFNDETAVGIDLYHTHVYASYKVCYDWDKPVGRRKFVRPIALHLRANYVGPAPFLVAPKPEFIFKVTFTSPAGTTYTLSDHIKISTPATMVVDRNMTTLARLLCTKPSKFAAYQYPTMRTYVTGLYTGPNSYHSSLRVLKGWD